MSRPNFPPRLNKKSVEETQITGVEFVPDIDPPDRDYGVWLPPTHDDDGD